MWAGIARGFRWTPNMVRRRIDILINDEKPSHVFGSSDGNTLRVPAPLSRDGTSSGAAYGTARGRSQLIASPTASLDSGATARPDCRRCKHFAVSWDPSAPYLCKGFGFKSRNLPSLEVLQADGHPCRLFGART